MSLLFEYRAFVDVQSISSNGVKSFALDWKYFFKWARKPFLCKFKVLPLNKANGLCFIVLKWDDIL
jgi:hypothetical protein